MVFGGGGGGGGVKSSSGHVVLAVRSISYVKR